MKLKEALSDVLLYSPLILMVAIIVYFRWDEVVHWDEFKVKHHCQIETVHFTGNIPDSGDPWVCDDGKTHW